MSDTPRTDITAQEIRKSGVDWHYSASLVRDFARELERENAKLRAQNIDFRAAQKACEVCDGPTMGEVAKLRAELEAARECIRRKDEVLSEMKANAEAAYAHRISAPGVIRDCTDALALTPESVAAEGKS